MNARFFVGMAAGSLLTVVLLVVVSIVGYPYLAKLGATDALLKAPLPPAHVQADLEWNLTSLSGEPFSLAELREKVIFLTFWSPECPYCMMEMGYIQELHDQMAPEGVAFVCVTADKYKEKAVQYVQETGLTLPMYVYAEKAPACFTYRITPATFIIDPAGTIAWAHEGAAKWNDENTIEYLRGLLIKKAA